METELKRYLLYAAPGLGKIAALFFAVKLKFEICSRMSARSLTGDSTRQAVRSAGHSFRHSGCVRYSNCGCSSFVAIW